MLLSTFKYLFFGAVVLLIGQIPIGGGTLGGKFAAGVGQACQWSSQKVHDSKMLAGVGDLSFVERWWKSTSPPTSARKHAASRKEISEPSAEGKSAAHDGDGVSQADREALIRLLQ